MRWEAHGSKRCEVTNGEASQVAELTMFGFVIIERRERSENDFFKIMQRFNGFFEKSGI